jgi:tRNA A-37 threonylcarbamoyl transferase component Bud32
MNKKDKEFSGYKRSFAVFKKFYSRKNSVYLVSKKDEELEEFYVLKIYRGKDRINRREKEEFFLKSLRKSSINVPEVLISEGDSMLIRYINGGTILDMLIDFEAGKNDAGNTFYRVIDIINDFYKYSLDIKGKGYILRDINLRNFIYSNDRIWRIDFEDCSEGRAEEDFGRFLAFILTYDPVFTEWKISEVKKLLEYISVRFESDINMVTAELRKELLSIEKRREVKVPFGRLDKIISL